MFDDAKVKREQLLALFEPLHDVVIHGVVGANAPGGTRFPPQTNWSLSLRLVAWRIPGHAVVQEELVVSKEVEQDELSALRRSIKAKSLIGMRAKICQHSPFGDTRAQLVSILPTPTDAELSLLLSQYLEPVLIDDPILGTLRLNKSIGCFEGKVSWLGKMIDLSVCVDKAGRPDAALETARALMAGAPQWHEKVANFALLELLELKNKNWPDANDQPVTPADFLSRMKLISITANADGSFDFCHDDGELFYGHSILVSGSLSGGLITADIPG